MNDTDAARLAEIRAYKARSGHEHYEDWESLLLRLLDAAQADNELLQTQVTALEIIRDRLEQALGEAVDKRKGWAYPSNKWLDAARALLRKEGEK
jgi:predicted lipoprotein